MKIGLITTIDTNIGDDFIRAGICVVLERLYRGLPVEYLAINKHHPLTVYPAWHPAALQERVKALPLLGPRLGAALENLLRGVGTRFHGCSLIVQCGAPVFWPGCAGSEWAVPLWREVVGALFERLPVLNLAAGSCYPWESALRTAPEGADSRYIEEILGYCRLTTARDTLAAEICRRAGWAVPLLPCSAFLAPYGQQAQLAEDAPILINYMEGGGHFDWGQGICTETWQRTVRDLMARLKKRHTLRFLCHDAREVALARELDPSLPLLFPQSVAEYFAAVKDAKFALCNRMHAAVGMAGMGISSVSVGTDTRLLMVRQLELSAFYAKDANVDLLEEAVESQLAQRMMERQRLLALQERTLQQYLSCVGEHVAS